VNGFKTHPHGFVLIETFSDLSLWHLLSICLIKGGAIEISILSKYYKTEICVVDIQTGRIDRFGEDYEYDTRVFILYDGIHFDPLYLETTYEPYKQTKFTTGNQTVMQQAIELGNEFRKARQFTDTSSFKLKCLVCQKGLSGQKEAQEHAKSSGHINFGEF
jgi:ubiquitin thioesterase OTU1